MVQAIAPVVFAARQQATDDEGAAEIAVALGDLIQTAAPGMAAGGFHTPNHRWVLVAALAQAQALYPELEVSATVDAYLDESIDINADGEYSERSTGVYNGRGQPRLNPRRVRACTTRPAGACAAQLGFVLPSPPRRCHRGDEHFQAAGPRYAGCADRSWPMAITPWPI